MAIIDELRKVGAHVKAFDPTTTGELDPYQAKVLDGVELLTHIHDVADDVDVICEFTEWPEFAKIDLDIVACRAGEGVTIVDMRNLLNPEAVKAAGLAYDGVGRS